MPRCVFREQPPPLLQPSLLPAGRLLEAIGASFYAWSVERVALYPSMEDLLEILAEKLGGFRPLTPLPSFLEPFAAGGAAWLASNPTPRGDILDCDTVCSHEPIVVYEGGRVALPAPSVAECGCRAYSVASLRDYGIDSSIAWVSGVQGGVSTSTRLPGFEELPRASMLVRRLRSRGLAAISAYTRPVYTGPFAAFLRERIEAWGEWRDGARYGARGLYAYSLYMEPGCYTRV